MKVNILNNYLKRDNNIFLIILFCWVISIPFKNVIYQISVSLMILYFLFFIIKNKDYEYLKLTIRPFKYLLYSFLLILFSMIISNFCNSVNSKAWINIVMYILRYGLVFVVLIYFYSKNFFDRKLLLIFILISLTVQLFSGIYQSIFIYDLRNSLVDNRIHGFTFHPNSYAFFMGIGLLLVFSLFRIQLNINKNLILFFIFLYAYVVLFSYSRGVWVSISLSFLIYLFIYIKELDFKGKFLIIIFVSFFCTSIFKISMINEKLKSILHGDSSGRIEYIWLPALSLIKEKLLIGHGIGIEVIQQYNVKIYELGGFHNIIIEILFYTGILGLLIFFIMFFQVLIEIIKQKSIIYFIILIFILIVSQFDHSIFISKPYLSTLTIFIFFVFLNRIDRLKNIKG